MNIKLCVRREFAQINYPLVWMGGGAFFVLALISSRIGGVAHRFWMPCSWFQSTFASCLVLVLFLLSAFACGMVFGAMFALRKGWQDHAQARIAIIVIWMHMLTMFAYPLYSVCHAWITAELLLLFALALCGWAIYLLFRVSWLCAGILIVHFIILLCAFGGLSFIIFMN